MGSIAPRKVGLFVTDIDGCLSVPFRPFRLERVVELRTLVDRARGADPQFFGPPMSICSGRSYAYVEAMAQLIGVDRPVLFESAGGMIDPQTMQYELNPAFTNSVERSVADVRAWCASLIEGTDMWIDHGKRTQAGVVGSERSIRSILPAVQDYVSENHPDLHCMHTTVSIDVLPNLLGKEHGMSWLASTCGISVDAIAYIGDSNGDIEALRSVGYSFAPANAADEVKAVAEWVTRGEDIDGVLEAYARLTAINGS